MKRIVAITVVAMSLAAGAFAGGTRWAHRSAGAPASAHPAPVYICPMDTDYHSDHPGNCPICGMSLVADRAAVTSGGDGASHQLPDGAVLVRFDASSPEWLTRRVLEFGADAEVVEPSHYRDAVRRAIA